MRALGYLAIAAIGLTACASPSDVRNMNLETNLHGYASYSWGKANVSFDDYTRAAWECTAQGTITHTQTDPNNALLGSVNTTPPNTTAAQTWAGDAAGEMQFEAQRAGDRQRHALIDACLAQDGYRRFGLTKEQVAHLATLARGSLERRRYLYDLGTNPDVLQRQRI